MDQDLILLTGATGYVGGHLLPGLTGDGRRVRCLVRRPEAFRTPGRRSDEVEVVQGDVLSPETLPPALENVHTAYYLIHSMASTGEYEAVDRTAAANFAEAAERARVCRLIYLGGLARGRHLSTHLKSRIEVGRILRESSVPTIEFQASIIIGLGSLSFEMVRALVHRLPVLVTPKWALRRAQPIYIGDVIAYLLAALRIDAAESRIFEIGGADRVSYIGIMRAYARATGRRRWILPVPVLTPRLSSIWLNLVTPLQAHVGRELIEGVRNESIVREPAALETFDIRPLGIREAIERAIADGESPRA